MRSEKEQLTQPFDTNRRVLVVNPSSVLWSYQLTLEAAFQYKSLGYSVHWLDLSPKLRSNELVNAKQHISLIRFKDPFEVISSSLAESGITSSRLVPKRRAKIVLPKFESVNELLGYRFAETALGAAIYSSITSKYKSTAFSIGDIYKDLHRFFFLGVNTIEIIKNSVNYFNPNLIVTTNDRLMGSSLSLEFAKNVGVDVRVIYWGRNSNCFQFYETSLYNSREWQSQIQSFYLDSPPIEVDYQNLINEIDEISKNPSEDSKSFLKDQIQGKRLKLNFPTCVFYAQSEYEHSPHIAANITGRFRNQYEAFRALMKICKELNINLILKHHPRRNGHSDDSIFSGGASDWATVGIEDWVLQLPADSDIDTYALIEDAMVNVVWTSTVGLESILREKKTIILGDCHWLDLDFQLNCWNIDTLRATLSGKGATISKYRLLPWYWFIKNYGAPFEYLTMRGSNLVINNSIYVLKPRPLIKTLSRITRTLIRKLI